MSTLVTTTVPHQPTGIQDLPPEILASAFETMIYTSSSDISLILPLTLVCRAWYELISYTPRLWGILTLDKHTNPRALAKRITRAKASPLSITVNTQVRVGNHHGEMGKQIKALAALVSNWVELDVGVRFLVAVCELEGNKNRARHPLTEPIGCTPVLGWVDMCRSLRSLRLERGGWDHEFPGGFFTHGGGVPGANIATSSTTSADEIEVKLHSFTSIGLPKPWILGFLGPHLKTLRLLRGERAMNPWAQVDKTSHKLFIALEDVLTILSRVPNATHIELERVDAVIVLSYLRPVLACSRNTVIHLPFLRKLSMRGIIHTALILGAIRAPELQTLSVTGMRTERVWNDPDQPFAHVFAGWSQPGFVMHNLHTLELVNCFKTDSEDDIPYMIRWLREMKSLVRLFLVQESQRPRGLEEKERPDGQEEEEQEIETYLFKALASPRISRNHDQVLAEWLCPSLMILRVDIPDTPIRTLISIARARGGGVVPYPHSNPPLSSALPGGFGGGVNLISPGPPARLRSIETRLCAAAEKADIDLLKSLLDNTQCICMNCALHLSLDSLALTDVDI